jgi:hypothetical protein
MLRTLAAQGERYIDAEELAAAMGKKPSGGHWNSGVAVLRNNGLIETDGRRYRCAALLPSARRLTNEHLRVRRAYWRLLRDGKQISEAAANGSTSEFKEA